MENTHNLQQFYKNTQILKIDEEGTVTHSDLNLFENWTTSQNIFEIHPFFEIIHTLETREKEYHFPCVHLFSGHTELICDINIFRSEEETTIVISDFTNSYRKLNKISQQRNESWIKNEEIEFTNKILIQNETFKDDLISNINHEITTPLASIQGFIELLKKTELDYEQEELVNVIVKESVHLKRIFNDMVDISNIELGSFTFCEENFDLIDLIEDIIRIYKPTMIKNALDFQTHIDPKINRNMYGDKTRVYQVISNMLNNAIKYTEEGFIKLSINRISGKGNKQHIGIQIEDSGIGIPKEYRQRIFDAFTQYNQNVEGTGLGLHVAHRIVKAMKGKISVESAVNKGTSFNIELFLRHAKDTSKNIPDKKEEPKQLPKNKKYRILVIENKLSTQYLLMKILLNTGSFYVDAVASAEDAIRIIENRKYDLIILDIKLQKMDGFQFARKIRKNYADNFIKNIPIIGISAMSTSNIKNLCINNGIDSFISKPFSQEALVDKITKLIYRKAQH